MSVSPLAADGLDVEGRVERPVHVIASPFKTGTTSVGKALIELGVGTREMPYDGELLRVNRQAIRAANDRVEPKVGFFAFKSTHERFVLETLLPISRAIVPFDVYHDAPFGHAHMHPFVRKIIAPNAKFIWVERETDDWLTSARKWEQSHPEVYKKHAQWDSNPEQAKQRRLKSWRRAERGFGRIRRAFPNDCLFLKWEDLQSFSALASFYGVPELDGPFPQSNVNHGG